jgi:iron complex transport system ATP-binding protein
MTDLRADNLGLERGGRPVLSDISLGFRKGRITVLLGANGAGKSSLLACLAGLLRPTRGRVLLDGSPLAALDRQERARRIGFLPQAPEIHWDVDVETLVGLGRLPHRGRWGESPSDRQAIERGMRETDVTSLARRSIGQLSGGERGRALVARVLAGEPDWLLVDEPLASLDPAHQLDLIQVLRRSAGQGRGVLLVVHDLPLAQAIADEAILLRAGRTVAAGPASDVFSASVIAGAFDVPFEKARTVGGREFLMPRVPA